MTQVLTLAEGRALLARQKGGKKAFSVPQERTKPPSAPKEPTKQAEALETAAKPQPEYYVLPYHVQVANGTHYPGRVRIVITGPANENLPAALVAAITEFVKP